jgi:hypothetical protein
MEESHIFHRKMWLKRSKEYFVALHFRILASDIVGPIGTPLEMGYKVNLKS